MDTLNEDASDPERQKAEVGAGRKWIQERLEPAWPGEWSHTFAGQERVSDLEGRWYFGFQTDWVCDGTWSRKVTTLGESRKKSATERDDDQEGTHVVDGCRMDRGDSTM